MKPSRQNRIHACVTAFQAASDALVSSLEQLSDEAAIRTPPDGGWNPAQIGWHVAATSELLAGMLTGEIPSAEPAPAGFSENPGIFEAVPAKMETFPVLQPPASAARAPSIAKLHASADATVKAIEALEVERASGHVVELPFGLLSLYQLCEFIGAHVARHQAQMDRAIAATRHEQKTGS